MDKYIPEKFNTPVRTFASGYNWLEKLAFLKNRVSPSKRFNDFITPLPKKALVNDLSQTRVRLGFTGDIMPIKDNRLAFSDEVVAFFQDVDYLVCNMEGVVTSEQRILAQSHRKSIARYLSDLFPPERIIVTVANNHAADFGYKTFLSHYKWLKDHFGYVIGAHDDAGVVVDGINLVSATNLSNQVCHYIAWLPDAMQWYRPDAHFNLLLPHWGYEMQLYPHPKQIGFAQDLLNDWNLIAGNHSHCPQPASAYRVGEERRAVIYSMGNFCYHHRWPYHRFGKIAKVEIGTDNLGVWKTGMLDWEFTRHDLVDSDTMLVRTTSKIHF